MTSLKFWFTEEPARSIPGAVLFDAHEQSAPVRVARTHRKHEKPGADWTIVEASREEEEEEAALRESWESGEPVEIAGVRFSVAVLARRRGWFSPARVRGVVMR